MLRFFITKKIECKGKLNKMELLDDIKQFYKRNNQSCYSLDHVGESIEKNFSVAGIFNYTTSYNIKRKIESPFAFYDNTGIPITFYLNK